jgi:gliding motility-associated-like protein
VCTGLRAGSYKFIIRDLNNCEVSRSADLLEPQPINISFIKSDFNGSNVTCRGYSDGSAEADVTGGNGNYSYYWYPASGSLSVGDSDRLLDSIPAGKYYLRVTDQMGCIKIDSVTLIDPPGMILTGSEVSRSNDGNFNISCNGANDGFINLSITGGSGTYTYLWVGPDGFSATTEDISGLKAGIYTCTVTDVNGCILMPQPLFNLTQPDLLSISTMSSLSADGVYNINCHGENGSIDITVSGGSPDNYNYTWSTSDGSGIVQGQQDQSALTAGSYHLLVSDINGCNAETNVLLTEPAALTLKLVPTNITCQSETFDNGSVNLTVTGGILPYSYMWSNGVTTRDINGLTEGYYSVTVTDANGCNREDSVKVNLPPPLAFNKLISTYNGFNISCFGRSDGFIQISPTSGLAPYNYSWQGPDGFNQGTKDISGLKAGRYTLIITDSNLCTGYDTIDMEEPGEISMAILTSLSMTGNHNINCNGEKTGSIEVEAVNNAGPVTYIWADGGMGSLREGLKAGSYKVIISDSNNCQADSLITITEPDALNLSFEITKPFCPDMPDGEIKLNVSGGTQSGYTYLWSDNSTGQNLTGAVSGLYSVTVTDLNNCTAEKAILLEPMNEFCLEIPNAISPNGDLINDVWNIGLKELYPGIEIRIFNRWGELIWKSEIGYPVPWDGRSNGSILPMDSYHYLIDLHNGSRPIIGHVTIVK